jgi:hypothetical protein
MNPITLSKLDQILQGPLPVKVKPIKDLGTFRDPKYLEFKKNYEQSKNT